MNKYLEQFQQAIEPHRQKIVSHPLYAHIKTPQHVRVFMEHHVFAVWDFMSLLKNLQQSLTCIRTPWMPIGSAQTRFLINEIVVGEECDIDANGNYTSHFELYLESMKEAEASTEAINAVIQKLHNHNIMEALDLCGGPTGAIQFSKNTFDIIACNKPHVSAAVFTFGREDLIPDMFMSLVKELQKNTSIKLDTFVYYLERHIEVDGGHHSKLALQMTEELCGTDPKKWEEAQTYTIRALEARYNLWKSALNQISTAAAR